VFGIGENNYATSEEHRTEFIPDLHKLNGKHKPKQHFVVPIENENLSRSAIDAHVYLYCVE